MISDIYRQQLKTYAKKLDQFAGDDALFEKLVDEITEEGMERAQLELIHAVTKWTKDHPSAKMEKRQEEIVETLYKYLGSLQVDEQLQKLKLESNTSLEEQFDCLNELIGLEAVKKQVRDLINYNKVQQLRMENGLRRTDKTLHMAFLGNPGTAKTTVARIVGKMYKAMGFLSKGHFIEAGRTDLIAEYQGQTAIKVKKLIKRAKGGVLFIDEAYSITENDKSDSYGRESLTELTKALEDYRHDLVVIVAGYPDLMEDFFKSNPGLKSRFNTFITFDDYKQEDLINIFNYICKQNDYVASDPLIKKLTTLIEKVLKEKNQYFANGRFMRNLFDDITMNQAKRLLKNDEELTHDDLIQLMQEDLILDEIHVVKYES